MFLRVRDVQAYDGSARTRTPEGYLLAPATIARVGVQEYTRRELGMSGDGRIRLYRPPEEVFAADAIASFENKPVTDGHPVEDVTAANWGKLARGEVRDVKATDKGIFAHVIVKDATLVSKIEKGKNPLSCGYDFELDETPGQTSDGRAYDGVMRSIRGNHVAVVDRARGGPECRIADGAKPMAKMTINGKSVELDDDVIAAIKKAMKDAPDDEKSEGESDKKNPFAKKSDDEDLAAARKAASDAASALVDALRARDEALELAKHATPAAIAARVADIAKATADAKALDAKFEAGERDAMTIRRDALSATADTSRKAVRDAVLGGVELAKADEDLIRRAFDAVAALAKSSPVRAGDRALGAALSRGETPSPAGMLTGEELMIQGYRSR